VEPPSGVRPLSCTGHCRTPQRFHPAMGVSGSGVRHCPVSGGFHDCSGKKQVNLDEPSDPSVTVPYCTVRHCSGKGAGETGGGDRDPELLRFRAPLCGRLASPTACFCPSPDRLQSAPPSPPLPPVPSVTLHLFPCPLPPPLPFAPPPVPQIILTSNVPEVGSKGTSLSVRLGFFRNFLFPRPGQDGHAPGAAPHPREQERQERERQAVMENAPLEPTALGAVQSSAVRVQCKPLQDSAVQCSAVKCVWWGCGLAKTATPQVLCDECGGAWTLLCANLVPLPACCGAR